MKMPCLGFYDEESDECSSFCTEHDLCKSQRIKKLMDLVGTLSSLKNTTDLSEPILQHFEKDFFSQLKPDIANLVKDHIKKEFADKEFAEQREKYLQTPVEALSVVFSRKSL